MANPSSSPLPFAQSSSQHGSSSPAPGRTVPSSSPLHFGSTLATPQGTPVRSPHRSRGELGSSDFREFDVGQGPGGEPRSTDGANPTSEGNALRRTLIWGTDVNTHETMERFKRFFNTYADAQGQHKYQKLLDHAHITGASSIDIDCTDLLDVDRTLYRQLVSYPQEVVSAFDSALSDLYAAKFHEYPALPLQARPFNLAQISTMRDLNPEDIDKLVAIQGMVIRTSPIIPEPKEGFFQCSFCKFTVAVPIDHGRIFEPERCGGCGAAKAMALVHNRCKFADKQMIKIQENPEHVPDGQTPQTVFAFAFDEQVDGVLPGDRIELTGIYRAVSLRVVARQRTIKSVFKTHIDVIHFKKTSSTRLLRDDEASVVIDPEAEKAQEARLRELSQQPDIVDRLVRSLAPNIFEFDDVKRGVLCQLFGGVSKNFQDSARGRGRAEIHVLLCGDPGTSKSQLLQYAVNLASRGIYTSGRGSSSVGLTAYVTKDPETRQLVLESGALVLCDGGVCCIDEFDKMGDSTRSVLHEAMEQQTISVAKAGIICSLNARTCILAAANPQESKWNSEISIVDNIQLPPTLLSRFDLIYLILDKADPAKDRRLARHLVSLYHEDVDMEEADRGRGRGGELDRATLTAYISYARRKVHPVLTEEACRDLVNAYVEMRKIGSGQGTITATPRQLESMVRLSEAHARMRFSATVERNDVADAVTLMRAALQQAATDPRTGKIDLDLITTGTGMAARKRIGDIARAVHDQAARWKDGQTNFSNLLQELSQIATMRVAPEDLRGALEQLSVDGVIVLSGPRPNPIIKFIRGQD